MDRGNYKKRRHNDKGNDEPHGIRLPGSILDELKKTEGDVDSNDSRYRLGEGMDKKRKTGLSRKDQRKQARNDKKKKKIIGHKDHLAKSEKKKNQNKN